MKPLKCGHPRQEGWSVQRGCKICTQEHRKSPRYREIHKNTMVNYHKRNKLKSKARAVFTRSVRMGHTIRPTNCSKCGAEGKIEAHHEDYTKPFEVIWLCRPCHREADAKIRKATGTAPYDSVPEVPKEPEQPGAHWFEGALVEHSTNCPVCIRQAGKRSTQRTCERFRILRQGLERMLAREENDTASPPAGPDSLEAPGLPIKIGDKFVVANREKRFLAQAISRLDDVPGPDASDGAGADACGFKIKRTNRGSDNSYSCLLPKGHSGMHKSASAHLDPRYKEPAAARAALPSGEGK